MKADSTTEFEEALRRMQQDGFSHHAQMALAVPPFLQALLLRYSRDLSTESFRYGILVDELLKLPASVHFISLNYDTLLDDHLSSFSPLETLDSYIEAPLGWSLIKPHGSVAWYVEQAAEFDPTAPPGDLSVAQAPIECVPTKRLELHQIRASVRDDPHGRTRRYPAIALPDGPKDQLVLPPQHLQSLRGVLGCPEIYLMVLGYSALDTEILRLIMDGGCRVRRLTVVNADAAAALTVMDRITSAGWTRSTPTCLTDRLRSGSMATG